MKIERMQIPDNDAHNWIRTLHEEGFSENEIDFLMSRMNRVYAEKKGIDVVEEEAQAIEDYLRTKYGRVLSADQRHYLRESVKLRFRKIEDAD